MIRDITIGQYYSVDSTIHRLDPRVKILGTLAYMISLFTFRDFAGYAVAVLFFALVLALSKVPFSYAARGLKPIFILMAFNAFLNLFWTDGTVFFRMGALAVTWEGLYKMIYISLRLILLVLGSSLMTLTTTPNQLTDGLERIFGLLKVFRVPVHEMAMMMSIALRFIPILIEETNRIMKAQTARGADFESGNLLQRLRNMLPLLIPLFVSAIRRATDLALAMDSRCYHGGAGRTKMYPLRYRINDFVAYGCLVAYIVILRAVVWVCPW